MREHRTHAMRAGFVALVVTTGALATTTQVSAHHVGSYSARDNEISQNFKQLKFAIQARKFDVALRLFDDGAVRREMRKPDVRLPAGLETRTREALRAGDAPRAEAGLAAVFAALARDLAVEAEAKVADANATRDARVAAGTRFLEAIWRYWNLIDFVVSERDPKAALVVRLAFDDARPVSDPAKLVLPLERIAQALTGAVETLAVATRRNS
jgi:hypothetical protein